MYDTDSISLTVNVTDYGKTESKLFAEGSCGRDIIDIATNKPVTYNHHHDGITPEILEADEEANNMFVITSTSVAPNGLRFVSSMEARDFETYPYYGVQWHPEKNGFEHSAQPGTDISFNTVIDRSLDAIFVSDVLVDRFITEVRKSAHVYTDVDRFPLIWNYEIGQSIKFEQLYFIPSLTTVIDKKQQQHEHEKGGDVSPAVTNLRSISQERSMMM